jgi:hypothetical protein
MSQGTMVSQGTMMFQDTRQPQVQYGIGATMSQRHMSQAPSQGL